MAAEDFENRQQLRTEELEAVEKATEILKSGSVTGMADKHLPGFLQTSLVLRGSKVADATIPSAELLLDPALLGEKSSVWSFGLQPQAFQPLVLVPGGDGLGSPGLEVLQGEAPTLSGVRLAASCLAGRFLQVDLQILGGPGVADRFEVARARCAEGGCSGAVEDPWVRLSLLLAVSLHNVYMRFMYPQMEMQCIRKNAFVKDSC